MQAWQDAYDMPAPPLNDKGRPRWPHAHQAKLAYLDSEFLTFRVDHHFVTELGVWLEEEPMPRVWRIRPSPSLMENAKRNDPGLWSQIKNAAKVNGYKQSLWRDSPTWAEVRDDIARTLFGRILVGVNIYAADRKRLESGFWPRAEQWLMPCNTIDVQHVARAAGHKKTNLAALCQAYGIEEEGVHTAESGVRTVRAVFEAMVRRPDGND